MGPYLNLNIPADCTDYERKCIEVINHSTASDPIQVAEELDSFLLSYRRIKSAWEEFIDQMLDCAFQATADEEIGRIVAILAALAQYPRWSDLPLGIQMREYLDGPTAFGAPDPPFPTVNQEGQHDGRYGTRDPAKRWINWNTFTAMIVGHPTARPSTANPNPPTGLMGWEWYGEAVLRNALENGHRREDWERVSDVRAAAKWIEHAADRLYDIEFAKDIDGGRPLREAKEGWPAKGDFERGLLRGWNGWPRWKEGFNKLIAEDEELKSVAAHSLEFMEQTEQRKSQEPRRY